MEFGDKEFAQLTYRIHEREKDADFFKLFPVFARFETFTSYYNTRVNLNYLMRYIIYCFDKNSPLVSIDNIFERRVKAAQLAGFYFNKKNRFNDDVEKVLLSKDFHVNCMVIQYCIMHAGEDYTTLVSFQDTLRKQLEKLTMESEEETTKDLISNIQKLRTDIREIRDIVFKFSSDPWLTEDLYSFMEMRRMRISPEDWARLLVESEEVVSILATSDE
jgi:hypothetical protein